MTSLTRLTDWLANMLSHSSACSPWNSELFLCVLLSFCSGIGSIPWIPSQTQAVILQWFCLQREQSRLIATCITYAHNLKARLQYPTWMGCSQSSLMFHLWFPMAGVEWKWILSLISLTAVNMLLRRHLSSLSKLQDHLQILSFSTPNIEALCQKSPSNIFIIFRELESYHQTWGVHSGID